MRKVLGVIRKRMATAPVWPDRVGGVYKGFCSWSQTPPTLLASHAIATHVVMHTTSSWPSRLIWTRFSSHPRGSHCPWSPSISIRFRGLRYSGTRKKMLTLNHTHMVFSISLFRVFLSFTGTRLSPIGHTECTRGRASHVGNCSLALHLVHTKSSSAIG